MEFGSFEVPFYTTLLLKLQETNNTTQSNPSMSHTGLSLDGQETHSRLRKYVKTLPFKCGVYLAYNVQKSLRCVTTTRIYTLKRCIYIKKIP